MNRNVLTTVAKISNLRATCHVDQYRGTFIHVNSISVSYCLLLGVRPYLSIFIIPSPSLSPTFYLPSIHLPLSRLSPSFLSTTLILLPLTFPPSSSHCSDSYSFHFPFFHPSFTPVQGLISFLLPPPPFSHLLVFSSPSSLPWFFRRGGLGRRRREAALRSIPDFRRPKRCEEAR